MRRAPIVEVVLNFGVEYAAPFSLDAAREFARGLDGFSRVEPIPGRDEGQEIGVIAYADDDTKAVQVTRYGLAINLFGFGQAARGEATYDSWEAVKSEAEPLWERFVSDAKSVDALSLRYVNRLQYQTDETGDRRLLQSWPRFCDDLIVRDPESFVMRMEAPLHEQGFRATIVHIVSHTEGGDVILTIDNDIQTTAYDGGVNDVWATFDQIRPIKNRLFREALTDTARAPYE
ncbi:MAG: TIGR04255 family protein [Bacteroidota bacterium]